jgi:transcriptional regulator with XRE-family HTH domain
MTGDQCKAARALLRWSQERLANKAALKRNVVADFETGRVVAAPTVAAIRTALEAGGIQFTNGKRPGVRLNTRR